MSTGGFLEILIGNEISNSPDGIVLLVGKGHADNKPGSIHASDFPGGEWDHAAIAFRDNKENKIVFLEKTPSKAGLWSPNLSGTIEDFAKYPQYDVVALALSRDFGPGAGEVFLKAAKAELDRDYSFFRAAGGNCSSAFEAGMKAVRAWTSKNAFLNKLENVGKEALKWVWWPIAASNTYTPTDAHREGKKHSVPPHFHGA